MIHGLAFPIPVTPFVHHTVASLTALSVLMCSVLCACPSFAGASADVTDYEAVHQVDDGDSAGLTEQHPKKTSGHCHGGPSALGEDDAPAQPCDDQGGKSCGYCEQPLISSTDNKPAELTPYHHFFTTFFSPVLEDAVQPHATAFKATSLLGAPPPAEWSTLLRLHCALIV